VLETLKHPHFWKRKSTRWITGILVLLIAIRVALPGILLHRLNASLADLSPLYQLHIGDLDLHLYRMAYSFDDVQGVLKKEPKQPFLQVREVEVSIAWEEIFHGRLVANVALEQADLKLTRATIQALSTVKKDKAKKDARDVKQKTVPFDLENVRLENSRFVFSDVGNLPPEQAFQMTKVQALATHLTPKDPKALSFVTASGALQNEAPIQLVGQLRTQQKPANWSFSVELRDFNLKSLNPMARRTVPTTFDQGELTLFGAVRSRDGKLQGYVKPFMKDLKFVGDPGDFKNVPQFLVEIGGTVANFLLKSSKNHSLATRVDFHRDTPDGKMKVETGSAVDAVLDNAFGDPLSQSMDETLALEEMPRELRPSIQARQAAAQLGTPYVTEVKFEKNSADLPEAEKKKIQAALKLAKDKDALQSVTVMAWSDQKEQSKELAEKRGEALRTIVRDKVRARTVIYNMAEKPDKLEEILQTRKVRIREALSASGKPTEKPARAFVIFLAKKK
jgi:hypothetical protein